MQAQEQVKEDAKGAVIDILVAPDPKLRVVAKPVVEFDEKLSKLFDDMQATMKRSAGLGLAATQVGSDIRALVVDVDKLDAYDDTAEVKTFGKFEMANPVILERSGKARWSEGCLSVPGFQDDVDRAALITVLCYDRSGKQFTLKAAGLLAACIQHEIDHLDGVLFIDHLSSLKKDIILRKLKKFRKKGSMVVRARTAPSM